MLSHSCQGPSNKILTWTVRTWAILLSSIFIALAAPPRLAADTAPGFTSATSVVFPQGIEDTFTITTSGNPVAKITSSGKLPGGVKFVDNGDGTATLFGRPGIGLGLVGDYALTFTASNGVLPAATQNFTLTITRPPRITSVNNATFVVGTAQTFTITTKNTVPKSTLSFTGTLPGGMTFTPLSNGTATLSGTPVAGSKGVYFLTITATNGVAPDATQSFTLFVVNPPPAITSVNNATFVVGTFGTFNVRTSPPVPSATVNFTGTLPAGITFAPNGDGTATIRGTAAAGSEGDYPIDISASNGTLPDAMQTFTITVQDAAPVPQAPAITSAATGSFTVGTAGTFTITATGTPTPSFTLFGAQPSWLSFIDNTDGTATLSGTPDADSDLSYSFTITA